jgi:hypothetical protein
LLDQLADNLDRFRRAITVVPADEVDLSPVYAALVIDHGEVSGFRFAYDRVGRSRAAVRHCVADLNLSIADAGAVLSRRQSQSTGDEEGGS